MAAKPRKAKPAATSSAWYAWGYRRPGARLRDLDRQGEQLAAKEAEFEREHAAAAVARRAAFAERREQIKESRAEVLQHNAEVAKRRLERASKPSQAFKPKFLKGLSPEAFRELKSAVERIVPREVNAKPVRTQGARPARGKPS